MTNALEQLPEPHVFPCGAEFMNMRFMCIRCKLRKKSDGFSPWIGPVPVRMQSRQLGKYSALLYPICRRCKRLLESKYRNLPKTVHIFFQRLLPHIRGAASRRGIPVLIDVDDLLALWIEQKGKCALSGYPLFIKKKVPHFRDPMMASVDRINSEFGYVTGNIQLVCDRANSMKGDMHHNDLIEWCKRILATQYAKEDELAKLVE